MPWRLLKACLVHALMRCTTLTSIRFLVHIHDTPRIPVLAGFTFGVSQSGLKWVSPDGITNLIVDRFSGVPPVRSRALLSKVLYLVCLYMVYYAGRLRSFQYFKLNVFALIVSVERRSIARCTAEGIIIDYKQPISTQHIPSKLISPSYDQQLNLAAPPTFPPRITPHQILILRL